jgi:hypothetical protein
MGSGIPMLQNWAAYTVAKESVFGTLAHGKRIQFSAAHAAEKRDTGSGAAAYIMLCI